MSTAPRRQPATKPDRIDPITTSVIQGALENIAIEMGYKLMRMSYSSIIRESEDFGAALVDAEGRGLAESAQSTPLQSGPIPGYVRGVLKTLAARGDTFRPGPEVCSDRPPVATSTEMICEVALPNRRAANVYSASMS